ncbi:MAG TPA: hypothetical protein VFW83_01735, partial [Bryobacteraceae bacterium]|nr:hypothetical protein [Bryobacteraceae bacterium]
VRESRSLAASKKSMIMQERLFFRNIPLSNWIEREMVVEEGADLDRLPKASAFTSATIGPAAPAPPAERRLPLSKMLNEFDLPPVPRESGSLIPARVVAFGAQ